MQRRLTKRDSIEVLRRAGMPVGTVIDIGVQRDSPDLRAIFTDVPHILFEPVAEYADDIARNYSGLDYRLESFAMSDREGFVFLNDVRADEAGIVTHVSQADRIEAGTRQVRTRSLDNYLHDAWKAGNLVAVPYLIKIDVDGHESEIMRGAKDALRLASCVIVETTLPQLPERCALAERAGLRLWDIVDISYYKGSLYQLDLVFVSSSFLADHVDLDSCVAIGTGNIDPEAWFALHNERESG